ncbi:alpha/beta hydrolase [Methylobacillus gramineus]|uniref:alpha/beta hydrolase n=1 Tax=Methylobacillus gramineus TaxID=755169 RepID=UPI001CFFEF22|nr:alpha/beta hydrolase [Methylobacillus gramineus]MCB5185899.1 alpha/beta hydrolase [Methylobacillus gramineus]
MKSYYLCLMSLCLAACTAMPTAQDRHVAAEKVATEAGWQRLNLDAGTFALAAFVPPHLAATDTLTIYIEGDGLAWVNAYTPSLDPTPRNPLALKLALTDPHHHAVYLARPCQYVDAADRRNCSTRYWTNERFAAAVIASTDQAITQLKQRYGANRLVLVGYSGGGAVAALTAARRHDIATLITVAGNLDIAAWTSQQQLSPLSGSLNPSDAWPTLRSVPQLHYVGERDNVITPGLTQSYQHRFPRDQQPEIVIIPGFDHYCCWVEAWPRLMAKPAQSSN